MGVVLELACVTLSYHDLVVLSAKCVTLRTVTFCIPLCGGRGLDNG